MDTPQTQSSSVTGPDRQTTRPPSRVGPPTVLPIAALGLAIAVAVELIGKLKIDVGVGAIVIFPMVWGLIAGLIASVQRIRPLAFRLQKVAAALVGVAVLILVARLAFNIGPSLPVLLKAGPALLLQEVGHLIGTVALALPLAVLLRLGRATIGATFSLDREPSFAMVSEKYGPDSDQYRGVLAMYVFGTLFGAVYITLLTSLVASWKIFDPLALAMGSGVGSGSMMAASAGSIIDAYPGQEQAILGMAAVSNLITTILGVYVGIYIALPLADRFYHLLTRNRDVAVVPVVHSVAPADTRGAGVPTEDDEQNRRFREQVLASNVPLVLPTWLALSVLTVLGVATASVAAKGVSWSIVLGYAVMIGLVVLGLGLARASRKISAIVWVTTIGAYASSPYFVAGDALATAVASVDFLSIATVMLTLAGLSLGKDVPLLRAIGWKIIPVGIVAITASFLLATVIAEFSLGLWH